MAAAVVAIALSHLAVLLVLNLSSPKPGTEPPPERPDFIIRFERPKPAIAPPPRKRSEPARPAPSARPARQPSPPSTPSAPAPQPAALPPQQPNYGRWTVAPAPSAQTQAPLATGLAGCTQETLATLTGAARDACARRLSEIARNAPALPLIGDKRKARDFAEQQAYADTVKAWRRSSAMTPHPCPPDKEPAHKLYLDKCSLMNAARQDGDQLHQAPALKLEFKYKF